MSGHNRRRYEQRESFTFSSVAPVPTCHEKTLGGQTCPWRSPVLGDRRGIASDKIKCPGHPAHRYRCYRQVLAEFTNEAVARGMNPVATLLRGWGALAFAERAGFEPAVGCPTHDFQSCTFGHSDTSPGGPSLSCVSRVFGGSSGGHVLRPTSGRAKALAEREGFEPSESVNPHQISSLAPSTTRTPLQVSWGAEIIRFRHIGNPDLAPRRADSARPQIALGGPCSTANGAFGGLGDQSREHLLR